MKIKNIIVSFLVITSMLMSNVYAAENVANIYVSVNGSDSGDGSFNAPLKTLQAANNMVAEIKGSYNGVNVHIMAGTYDISDLKFGAANSGSSDAQIVWKAYNNDKVILTSEQIINNSRITTVNADTIQKIPLLARGDVKQVKLTAEEIKAIGPIRYTGQRSGSHDAPAYLAQDGKMYEIAGYPNKINMTIADSRLEVTDAGFVYTIDDERVNRWSDVKDAYLVGNPTYEWYEDTLKIADITGSKITTSEGGSYHYRYGAGAKLRIVNLVEEIDYPGEFYIDREEGYLYFYPIDNISGSTFALVTSQKPFMTVEGAQHISFENFIFEGTCSTGIVINNSDNITLKNCELKNIGKYAIDINNSKNTTITGSHIHDIGKAAIIVSGGGNSLDFTPGNNKVTNCHIEKYGKVLRRNANAISLSGGVGNIASHNRIHAADHSAISFSGNYHIIEYNDIYDVLNNADDAGAIYAGRSWVDGGTEIRYNYIHDNPYSNGNENAKSGVYLDDSFTGTKIYGNVFANMNAGVKLHASNYNDVQNNVFINLKSSVRLGNPNGETDYKINQINTRINNLLKKGEATFKSSSGYQTLSATENRGAHTLYERYFEKYDPYDTTGKYNVWNTNFPYLKDFISTTGKHMSPKGNVIKNNATFTGGQTQVDNEAICLVTSGLKTNNPDVSMNYLKSTSMDVNNIDYAQIQSFNKKFETLDITKAGIEGETSLTLDDFGVVYPQNDANIDPGSVVLIWNGDSGAEKYKLVVSKNADLSNPIVNKYVEGDYYKLDGLTAGSTYYWTVDAETAHRLYSNKTKRINEGVMSFTAMEKTGVVTLSNIVYRNGDGNKINAIENSSVNVVEFDLTNYYPSDINAVATLESFDGTGVSIGKATVTKDVAAYETIRAGVGISTSADKDAYMILTINSQNGCELQYRIDNAAMSGQEKEDKLAITSVTIGSGTIVNGSENVITSVVKSLADGQQSVRCIMATYDSNDVLVDSDNDQFTMIKGEEHTFETEALVSSDTNAYVKLFFWNDKMQPLITDYDVK